MTSTEPGDRMPSGASGAGRRLERPPSERYERAATASDAGQGAASPRSALYGPLARAILVGAVGALVLAAFGAVLALAEGLLLAAGLTGAAVGLVLARAAAPGNEARPVPRRTITWLAILIALGAAALGDVAIWIYAVGEGGTLGLVDYLLTTFGLLIPGEAVIGALTAAWGANAGPVQG